MDSYRPIPSRSLPSLGFHVSHTSLFNDHSIEVIYDRYLRWWFVEKVINVFGKGVFRDDLPIIGPHLVRLYYVLMGASIGRRVKIHRDAKLGQADLLTIGDDVCIDNAVVRPFSIEEV